MSRTIAWIVMILFLGVTRFAAAADPRSLSIYFTAEPQEQPKHLCIIASKLPDGDPVAGLTKLAPKGALQYRDGAEKKCAGQAAHLDENKLVESKSAAGLLGHGASAFGTVTCSTLDPRCTPTIEVPEELCDAQRPYQIACELSPVEGGSGGTLFVWIRSQAGDPPELEQPVFNGTSASITVKNPKKSMVVSARVLGGDYVSKGDVLSSLDAQGNMRVTLPTLTRCPLHELRFPPDTSGEATFVLPGDAKCSGTVKGSARIPLPNDFSGNEQRIRVAMSNGTVVGYTWFGVPPEAVPLAYNTVGFRWKRHGLYDDLCPEVTLHGKACKQVDPAADDCAYACDSETPIDMPAPLHFKRACGCATTDTTCASTAEEWDEVLGSPDAHLSGYVPSDQRTVVLLFPDWAKAGPANATRAFVVHLPNGETVEVTPQPLEGEGLGFQTIRAPGLERGSILRYQPEGERPFREDSITVERRSVKLSPPADLAKPWTASVFAGASFTAQYGVQGGLPGNSAIVGDLVVSYRAYDWRVSIDLHATYSLILNWSYSTVNGTPGAPIPRTDVLYDRLAIAPGFTWYRDAGLGGGAFVGLGPAWPVFSTNDQYVDGSRLTTLLGIFGRARALNSIWVEGALIWIPFGERHYGFEAGTSPLPFSGSPMRVGANTGEVGFQLGLRIGNHTYPRYR